MKKIIILVIIFLSSQLYSQEIYFKSFTTEDGLSNNSINDIENDANGALWIGSWDGLNYFDGKTFTIYKHNINDTTSIAGNEIRSILRDSYDNIWLHTDQSITKYLGKGRFKNFFFDKVITALFLNKEKKVSIRFLDGSNFIYENNSQQFIQKDDSIKITNQEKLVYTKILQEKYPNLVINDIFIATDKVFFATKLNGLFVLKIENNTYNITNYKKDLYNLSSLRSNEIEKIHKDVFGDIWLALKDGGISVISNNNGIKTILPHPINNPHLPSETIRAITKDSLNNIWLGYYSKGLYRFDKHKNYFVPFEIPKSKQNKRWNFIRSLYVDSLQNIWVGTYAGIIKITQERITYYSADDFELFPNNRNYTFFEDDEKNLWIGCWGGVAKINLHTLQFESFKGQKSINHLHVRTLYRHKQKLLIGTENEGLIIFDLNLDTTQKITEKNGLAGNSVFSIVYDEEFEKFWISCLGGVSQLNSSYKVLKSLTEKNGLPSHMVYGLAHHKDFIWVSTTKGIGKINTKTFVVENLSAAVNWQAKEFSEGAYYKDNSENLYFGGVKGLSFFNSNTINITSYLPKIYVLIEDSNKKSTIKPYTKNYLNVEIVPISFQENTNNKILYKLEGFDSSWREFSVNTIFYKKLPYGSYTFKVKNSLEPQKEPLSFQIIIQKPFYLKQWFIIIICLTTLLSLVYYGYHKNETYKIRQEILKKEVAKNTLTITSQKEELLQLHNSLKNNEFEVNTFKREVIDKFKKPLTLILENLSEATILPEKKDFIATEVANLMNRVIQWDYLENISLLPINNPVIVASDTIKKALLNYQKQFEEKNILYTFHFNSSVKYVELDVVRSRLLVQYFFNVLLNYRKPTTELTIVTHVKSDKILLRMQTNNKIIIDNISNIKKYNVYFKAFEKLLYDINGTFIKNIEENLLETKITIPVKVPSGNYQEAVFKSSKISLSKLPEDKINILVYANKDDFMMVDSLIASQDFNLIYEDDLKDISKYISKSEIIKALIFYNVPFSSKVIELSEFIQKNKPLPTIYIAEIIDYSLQEKILQHHINEVIHLPASKNLMIGVIKKLLSVKTKSNNLQKSDTQKVHQRFLKEAVEVIESNYSNVDFNVEALAQKLNISRIKCYRMFKEAIQQSPSDYLNQFRMKRAADLLETTSLNVSEVAFECGFKDPKYFSKTFKKYYGLTPKNYLANKG